MCCYVRIFFRSFHLGSTGLSIFCNIEAYEVALSHFISPMSEFITIQVGQCGNQIGNCFWKHAVQEYGIELTHSNNQSRNLHVLKHPVNFESFNSFFWCSKDISRNHLCTIDDLENAQIKARAVCIDMEDSVVARFRRGPLRGLFNETCLLTSYPGSGNNWAEGFYSHGTKYFESISEKIRVAVEHCDGLHGFLLLYSLGGGTGSGLGSRVLSLLEEQYPHIDRLVTCVYPAGNEDVVTAPYNVALATHELINRASCVFPVNNQALMEISGRENLSDPKNKNRRYFHDLNNIIVNMLLHLTSGARFPGSFNVDMNEITTNMIPFPGLNYLTSSISPVNSTFMKPCSSAASVGIDNILSGTWARSNQLIKVDPLSGVILAAAVIARGEATLGNLRQNIEKLKEKGKFVSWNQDALKIGLCSVPHPGHKTSALGLFNSTSLASLFQEVSSQFRRLFRRRAHTHHYTQVDGFEISQFQESLEQLQDISNAYSGLTTHEPIIPPRLKVL